LFLSSCYENIKWLHGAFYAMLDAFRSNLSGRGNRSNKTDWLTLIDIGSVVPDSKSDNSWDGKNSSPVVVPYCCLPPTSGSFSSWPPLLSKGFDRKFPKPSLLSNSDRRVASLVSSVCGSHVASIPNSVYELI